MSKDNPRNTISRIDLSLVGNVDMIGCVIADRWEIVRLLGQGRMSTVYKAEEEHTRKPIVLKLLHNQLLQDVDLKELEEHTRSLLALNHEHISNFHNVYLSSNNEFFLCCDYFEADSLESILSTEGHISVERASKIFIDIADGLSYAHKQNILHKDIKPSNIRLINDSARTDYGKIVDFGITSLLMEKMPELDSTTSSLSKPCDATYMSPEQCLNNKVDNRSDIYSLGCVMYECVNGSPPFAISNLMETVYKHAYAFPDPINAASQEGSGLGRYQAIVMKTLEKNPSDRYQSMQALKDDLELLFTASEEAWKENALAARIRPIRIAQGIIQKNLKRKLLIAFIALALFAVLATSYVFVNSKVNQNCRYNDRLLWALKDKKQRPAMQNFEGKKKAAVSELSSIEKEAGRASPKYEAALYNYSNLLILATDWSDAIAQLKELSEIHDNAKGSINPSEIHSALALCYFAKGYLETAEGECQLAIKNIDQGNTKSIDAEISALNILGDIYTQRGDDARARDNYLVLYKVADQSKLRWPPVFGFACARLADTYRRLGDLPQAEHYYKEGVDWWQNYVGRKGTFLPRALYGYGLVLAQEKQFSQALQQQNEALSLAVVSTGQNSSLVAAIKQQYSECLFHTNLSQWLESKFKPKETKPD